MCNFTSFRSRRGSPSDLFPPQALTLSPLHAVVRLHLPVACALSTCQWYPCFLRAGPRGGVPRSRVSASSSSPEDWVRCGFFLLLVCGVSAPVGHLATSCLLSCSLGQRSWFFVGCPLPLGQRSWFFVGRPLLASPSCLQKSVFPRLVAIVFPLVSGGLV